jgi:hypothetical protein
MLSFFSALPVSAAELKLVNNRADKLTAISIGVNFFM